MKLGVGIIRSLKITVTGSIPVLGTNKPFKINKFA